tara:strand:+ start:174 stop:620 length:447 start_codon:yes stop_codon:yes gene_type:complete
MSKIKTFRGKLSMGLQERIHLSTADGLTGYKIKNFQIISAQPGIAAHELVAKIFTTDQTNSVTAEVNFNDPDLIAVTALYSRTPTSSVVTEQIIVDSETINQDIFVTIADASGATTDCNFYIELEQFKLNINESTFTTLKNIRSNQQN